MFFSAYVIVKSLSIDNIFAIAVIFAYWRVAAAHQRRVLFWGILGALVMRGIMIAAGVALIERVSWITYVFGGLLLVTAAKMLLAHHYPIPTPVSLGVISGILTAGVLASVLAGHRDRTPLLSPLADELENLAEYSWKQVRRIVVLLAGATLLLTGLAMIVLPGPAILFIPAGLAILASEFLWARKLLAKMRQAGSSVLLRHDKGNRKDEAAKKR